MSQVAMTSIGSIVYTASICVVVPRTYPRFRAEKKVILSFWVLLHNKEFAETRDK